MKDKKVTPFYMVAVVYAFFIAAIILYLTVLQHIGIFAGMQIQIGAEAKVITALDILIFLTTIASFALLGISLLAFKRKRDIRIFIISVAFFLFALKEFLFFISNFLPDAVPTINNVERGLGFLILVSFMMLMYASRLR